MIAERLSLDATWSPSWSVTSSDAALQVPRPASSALLYGHTPTLSPGVMVLTRNVFWSRGDLVPKADVTIIAGGTEDESEFDGRSTVAGVASLLRTWAGCDPSRNLIVATGHHRKGILFALLAVATVASLIKGGNLGSLP